MDQVVIRAEQRNKSTITIYADPKVRGFSDLLIKGGQFYAVYDPNSHLWKRGLDDLSKEIDDDILNYAQSYEAPEGMKVVPKFMNSMSNGAWNRYLTQLKGLQDSDVQLDQKILFANDDTDRSDYASFKEEYELKESPIPNYEKLMSTIYEPEERRKLEWGIGLLVDGKNVKNTHKFFVICGDPGTGKSTILHIIEQLFKGYVSYFNAKELGQGYTFATASFKNAPLIAIQTDGDLSHIYDNTLINQISAHETIIVNEKGVKQYPVTLNTIMFMATNKPVRITDAQSGIIRRLIDVYPSGRTLAPDEYFKCMESIQYELGGIAYHCLNVYRSMGANAYGAYQATRMIARTNDVYSFLSSQLDLFETEDVIDGDTLWRNFKTWCEESNIESYLKKDEFLYEVSNYFNKFTNKMINGHATTKISKFEDFKWDKFEVQFNDSQNSIVLNDNTTIDISSDKSKFDEIAKDWPAQYAKDDDIGGPLVSWDNCTTTLKDIDTTKLHWVRVPEKMIVLDFDLKGDDGKKDIKKNIEAASHYPSTYAELSKSGGGIHLHYFYDGDVTKLKPLIDMGIECKVYRGKSALRRKLTKCNDLNIAHISSGLPLKEENTMINTKYIKDEQHIRNLIKGNLQKKYCAGTKPSINFICTILDEAYEHGIKYNVTDMRPAILQFAMNSTHWPDYCVQVVGNMKFKSQDEEVPPPEANNNDPDGYTFFDTEVFPNMFMICFKDDKSEKIDTWINPPAKSIRELCTTKALIGFNNRNYDNHILYAWGWLGYDNLALYNLSSDIVSGKHDARFQNAYNLSYADIYDFSSKKQSLKKWEIELNIDHHELGMRWDEPVPESKWPLVQSYCEDDVRATEAVFNHLHEDFIAREGLANLSGLSVNDTTNQHTTKIIFGNEKNPQKSFPFPDLRITFPGYEFNEYAPKGKKSKYRGEYTGEGGYVWVYGMSNGDGPEYWNTKPAYYRTRDQRLSDIRNMYSKYIGKSFDTMHPELVKMMESWDNSPRATGVWKPNANINLDKDLGGMFGNVALYDVASMHPSSLEDMNFFGPFTDRFSDIKKARIDIKHKDLDSARKRMNGALAPLLKDGEDTSSLAQALKIVINSVYGLTSAKFPTKFNDVANGSADRNKDNKVAKRGALFMVLLKHCVQSLGYTVVHIKTDSIKVADADPIIGAFVCDFGLHYGYTFEHESTYDRMVITDKAQYIAYSCYGKHNGEWTATGALFQHPYIFKTLFTHEPIEFKDYCETKSVTSAIYLDFNEGLDPDEHRYSFVGKVSSFVPVKNGCGGGILLRQMSDDKYSAVAGSKGWRWKEASVIRDNHLEDQINMEYYTDLCNNAYSVIDRYCNSTDFCDINVEYVSQNPDSSKGESNN